MKIGERRLKEILKDHQLWLTDTTRGKRADLSRMDLSRAKLAGANLERALLYETNLQGARLEKANLRAADLRNACLDNVSADYADFSSALLESATLRGAYVTDTKFVKASLYAADLRCASADRADFTGANLIDSYLHRAILYKAILTEASLPDFQLCPEKGSFTAFKRISSGVIELFIPARAKRTSSLVGRKCRASEAKVVRGDNGCSTYEPSFRYVVGEVVRCREKFDDDIRWECASGIHFFMTHKEAEEY